MKKKELKAQNPANLKTKLSELRAELLKEKAQIAVGTLPKNPGKIRNARRTIARILTLLKQQEASKERGRM